MPFCLRILAENVLRHIGHNDVSDADLERLAAWQPDGALIEVPFHPARVLMQDYTGIPALVDLAALRDASSQLGVDPLAVNPQIPLDLVIDHSLIVDYAGRPDAVALNLGREYERNAERFSLAKWAQSNFQDMRVVPPGSGILHQVNIEHIASVVRTKKLDSGVTIAYPDTMVGTDSHSTMVNGLGVLGWGVGGIEAEAALLGLPLLVPVRRVIGVRLSGKLREGVTTTDLVLTLTQKLRQFGVVDAFVEFCGPALDDLSVSDRATVANMAPEFGSTCAFFPIDSQTLRYLSMTGRDPGQVALVEEYAKAQGLWRDDAVTPSYSAELALDLAEVEPCVAGPRRPHDRVALAQLFSTFEAAVPRASAATRAALSHGSVVLAAITSCTNTSNPSVMLAAGLVAEKAMARGLRVPPWVKTSLTPGSRVVADYLKQAGLQRSLDGLGFHVAGYGCATCGGNSGNLSPDVERAIQEQDLTVCAVLSGNRNFEARIHPLAKANYLMSPPLVVAFALAGRIDLDFSAEPLGHDNQGAPVFLRDIWPSSQDIASVAEKVLSAPLFVSGYADLFKGDGQWSALDVPQGVQFPWQPESTYIRRPPYLDAFDPGAALATPDVQQARVLVMLGDAVTTDHISPVGAIAAASPAARYLEERGVRRIDFNAYGSRRSNHEVMVRGTFANIRLRNELLPGSEGGVTRHFDSGDIMPIFDAAQRYAATGTPLVIIAGKDYGAGSSRDWAAKGTRLLGACAVIAQSFERIHRSNLVNMGVLPLQFPEGVSRESLGLDGSETLDLVDIGAPIVTLRIHRQGGGVEAVPLHPRLDTANERSVWRHGGMMPFVMRRMVSAAAVEAVQ
ncbi:aconitate hydratase AcnA [Variovorax sp. CYS-02]|uniref:Aconitate hydratase n=1 Tax=Variovorax terrae TaxID=2923278 RepID=A0A9X1VY25_9BURK|nr:aconitate hydratase AcnA [Variovorax terrae]